MSKFLHAISIVNARNVYVSAVAHRDKTLPRIQKHVPESKNASRNPRTLSGIQNTSQNPKAPPRTKCFWILRSFGFLYICNLGGPFYIKFHCIQNCKRSS